MIISAPGDNIYISAAQVKAVYIRGGGNNTSHQLIIDSTGASFAGNLTVSGNFTVSGTTTTLNTATLNVEDKNITLNYGAGNTVSTANGSGITIQDAMAETMMPQFFGILQTTDLTLVTHKCRYYRSK